MILALVIYLRSPDVMILCFWFLCVHLVFLFVAPPPLVSPVSLLCPCLVSSFSCACLYHFYFTCCFYLVVLICVSLSLCPTSPFTTLNRTFKGLLSVPCTVLSSSSSSDIKLQEASLCTFNKRLRRMKVNKSISSKRLVEELLSVC